MALDVNGAAILSAIAAHPSAFGMDEAEVNALALSRVLTRLKDKALTLDHLRSLLRAIGADDCKLALDHLAGKDIAALLKRLEPKNPDLRGADENWQRRRVVVLAEGAEPATATVRATRPAKTKPPSSDAKPAGAKTGAVMKSKALTVRPKSEAV